MASGHVNRTNRPNTWLHRQQRNVKISLANSEPSTHGTSRRSLRCNTSTAIEGKADLEARPTARL
jgi:hypothetical protein